MHKFRFFQYKVLREELQELKIEKIRKSLEISRKFLIPNQVGKETALASDFSLNADINNSDAVPKSATLATTASLSFTEHNNTLGL